MLLMIKESGVGNEGSRTFCCCQVWPYWGVWGVWTWSLPSAVLSIGPTQPPSLRSPCGDLTFLLTDQSLHTCLRDLLPLQDSRPSMLLGPCRQRPAPDSDWETCPRWSPSGWDLGKKIREKDCKWAWNQGRGRTEEDFIGQSVKGYGKSMNFCAPSSFQLWASEKFWKSNEPSMP